MKYLVTGAAGFIASKTAEFLLKDGHEVVGVDNLNDYYDPALKDARLALLTPKAGFSFVKGSLEDRATLEATFDRFKPDRVVNLAAQAGVRTASDRSRSRAKSANISTAWSASRSSAGSCGWRVARPTRPGSACCRNSSSAASMRSRRCTAQRNSDVTIQTTAATTLEGCRCVAN